MPLTTVRFDRVFDIVVSTKDRKPVTFFSFESNGARQFAVPAPGKPDLRTGAVVTAYLGDEGNWQTLLGWKDHATGELIIESAVPEIFVVIVSIFLALLFVWHGVQLTIYLGAEILILGTVMIFSLKSILHILKAHSALRRIPLKNIKQ
ncbi:hypothetical protein [Collimonas sp. OK412]|jgi:hypothetical protein|uniref:hypothetical protein n=1 Tax=Collimonas sp. (strain OK412) TaxID=1801619 RepID=UPI001113C36C|nr:hypothetical protein [Collimonas sp. OK412]